MNCASKKGLPVLEQFSLAGKAALITGGARGIGFAVAQLFSVAGARVAIIDIDASAAENSTNDLARQGYDVAFFEVDLTQPRATSDAVAEISAAFGRIDVAVNCAGICINTPVLDVGHDEWRHVIDVNQNAMFFGNCPGTDLYQTAK